MNKFNTINNFIVTKQVSLLGNAEVIDLHIESQKIYKTAKV